MFFYFPGKVPEKAPKKGPLNSLETRFLI